MQSHDHWVQFFHDQAQKALKREKNSAQLDAYVDKEQPKAENLQATAKKRKSKRSQSIKRPPVGTNPILNSNAVYGLDDPTVNPIIGESVAVPPMPSQSGFMQSEIGGHQHIVRVWSSQEEWSRDHKGAVPGVHLPFARDVEVELDGVKVQITALPWWAEIIDKSKVNYIDPEAYEQMQAEIAANKQNNIPDTRITSTITGYQSVTMSTTDESIVVAKG